MKITIEGGVISKVENGIITIESEISPLIIVKKYSSTKSTPESINRVCAVCGDQLTSRHQKYCSHTCATQGQRLTSAKWYLKHRNTILKRKDNDNPCKICGKPVVNLKQRYCSKFCREEMARRNGREYARMRREKLNQTSDRIPVPVKWEQ